MGHTYIPFSSFPDFSSLLFHVQRDKTHTPAEPHELSENAYVCLTELNGSGHNCFCVRR